MIVLRAEVGLRMKLVRIILVVSNEPLLLLGIHIKHLGTFIYILVGLLWTSLSITSPYRLFMPWVVIKDELEAGWYFVDELISLNPILGFRGT